MDLFEAYRVIAPHRADDPAHTARMQQAMGVLFAELSTLGEQVARKYGLDASSRDDAVSGVLLGLIRATTDRAMPADERVLRRWLYRRLEWYVLNTFNVAQRYRTRHPSLDAQRADGEKGGGGGELSLLRVEEQTAEGVVSFGLAVRDEEEAVIERQLIDRFFGVIVAQVAATLSCGRGPRFTRSIRQMFDVYGDRCTWEALVEAEGVTRNTLQQRFARARLDILRWLDAQRDLPDEEREAYRQLVAWLLRERQ